MDIRKILLERIEKNAIKVNVNGEKIYLKKSGFLKEWHVIYPPIDPETGKWDYINLIFGSKGNVIGTLLVVFITFLVIFGLYDFIREYNLIFSNPAVKICLEGIKAIMPN